MSHAVNAKAFIRHPSGKDKISDEYVTAEAGMNQENEGKTSDVLLTIPLKRKRGRPRKDQGHPGRYFNSLPHNVHGQNRENAHIPPGFGTADGNQPQQVDAADNADDSMVGQVVTGVVEAAFDAGYLLSVRVGGSDTRLRGVVFKPGHYVPVTAENDVAPHVRMIRRNEVPFPAGNQAPAQGNGRRSREKNEHRASYSSNWSPVANQLVTYKGKQTLTVPANLPPPVGARGTVVPVVLQPVNFPNGMIPSIEAPPIASQPAHLAASKAKQVSSLAEPQSSLDVKPKSLQMNNESTSEPEKTNHHVEGNTSRSPVMAFDQLVNEVVKRIQVSSGSVVTENECGKSVDTSSSKASGLTAEQIQDLSRPLLIKPLQAIRSDAIDHSAPASQTQTGKMTELLLAVQENLMEKQGADAQLVDSENLAK
ncbi:hypothetical protein Nepgr_027351 [Nepenthes gracilis]|uniref:Uncharacterized protein n=1 Tax=Nepenthes gracilis TaxID=150966 RepID=A0AAD3TA85_NEPGR|nr:hypothetical protein Nepgr_027351 [Nepenthes gracilis]